MMQFDGHEGRRLKMRMPLIRMILAAAILIALGSTAASCYVGPYPYSYYYGSYYYPYSYAPYYRPYPYYYGYYYR